MKLRDLNNGDVVYHRQDLYRPFTVAYVGIKYVVLREGSHEFTILADDDSYVSFDGADKTARLTILGDDLVDAIAQAAWECHLASPTPHMQRAIENWRERFHG